MNFMWTEYTGQDVLEDTEYLVFTRYGVMFLAVFNANTLNWVDSFDSVPITQVTHYSRIEKPDGELYE